MQYFMSKKVKTTKDRDCFGCGKIFPKGSYLVRWVNSEKGKILSVYVCEKCNEYAATIDQDAPFPEGFSK